MQRPTRFAIVLLSLAVWVAAAPAQQTPPPNRITLDVVVTPKSGAPVSGLGQQDFTILVNKAAQPIVTFNAISGRQAPIEVVLLVDAVNTNFTNISYERQQIDKFLRADGGRLPYPTSLAIFTDTGTQVQQQSTRDGNELSAALDQTTIGLRDIRRSAGFWGADDRIGLSLNALQSLAARESTRPGRKIILWISPGWPYLSGPEVQLDGKEEQQLFAQVVALSTQHHALQRRPPRLRAECRAGVLLRGVSQRRRQAQPGSTRQPGLAGARSPKRRPRAQLRQRYCRPPATVHRRP
jgi:VWFA-related protein